MRRVIIIGCGGAGKSTLARKLGERTGLPVIHLDRVYWKSGWVQPTRAEFIEQLNPLLTGNRWIMDGNFSGTLARRVAAADTILFLDLPTWQCLLGVVSRVLRGYGRTRPDMAAGCPDKLDLEFLGWVFHYRRRSFPKTWKLLRPLVAGKTLIRFRTRGEVNQWLKAQTQVAG